VRGGSRHFTHSKVMAWVAFDRGIKAVESFGRDGPVDRWRRIRAEIHEEICRRAFNVELGSFTQTYDNDCLDASALLIPQVGFLLPDDGRVLGTIAAIERRLVRGGSCSGTTLQRPMMAYRPAKALSSPAAFGWPTPMCSPDGALMRAAYSNV
jgi:GH15 family glucan-1,4-alpha-glucosidase